LTGEELPKAKVRRRRLFRLAWVIPVLATAVASYLVFQRVQALGPEITIRFSDGAGLRPGQTPVRYRGVPVGEVTRIELSRDHQQVLVRARLQLSAAGIAREGARFWIVRPQVGWGNVTGLGTVLTGPEVQVQPGSGEAQREFTGLESAPIGLETEGLKIILRADRPKSIKVNTPVYYRGVEVGAVQKIDLGPHAAVTDIHVLIFRRYAGLVRDSTAFWNAGGASLKANLLKGLELEVESLRALVTGGIEFATPSEKAPRAKQGAIYFLYDEPKKEWLAWTPRIPVPQEKN